MGGVKAEVPVTTVKAKNLGKLRSCGKSSLLPVVPPVAVVSRPSVVPVSEAGAGARAGAGPGAGVAGRGGPLLGACFVLSSPILVTTSCVVQPVPVVAQHSTTAVLSQGV